MSSLMSFCLLLLKLYAWGSFLHGSRFTTHALSRKRRPTSKKSKVKIGILSSSLLMTAVRSTFCLSSMAAHGRMLFMSAMRTSYETEQTVQLLLYVGYWTWSC